MADLTFWPTAAAAFGALLIVLGVAGIAILWHRSAPIFRPPRPGALSYWDCAVVGIVCSLPQAGLLLILGVTSG